MSLYKYKNENPLNKETGDCVVRALVTATGEDYDTILRQLFDLAFELKTIPNGKECWEMFLRQKGWIRNPISNKKGSKRPTVESFTKDHKQGTYIVQVANHLTVVKDGYYYDIWDCGKSCFYS